MKELRKNIKDAISEGIRARYKLDDLVDHIIWIFTEFLKEN